MSQNIAVHKQERSLWSLANLDTIIKLTFHKSLGLWCFFSTLGHIIQIFGVLGYHVTPACSATSASTIRNQKCDYYIYHYSNLERIFTFSYLRGSPALSLSMIFLIMFHESSSACSLPGHVNLFFLLSDFFIYTDRLNVNRLIPHFSQVFTEMSPSQ